MIHNRFNKFSSPQQRFLQRYGNVVSAARFLTVAGYALNRPLMERAGFPLFFEFPLLRIIAILTSFIFLIGLIIAQWQMGYNWRVGIDEENRTELVTSGFFRYVRNPVFTMTFGGLASIALVFPGAVTLLLWCMSFTGLYLQVLTEEEFLLKQHRKKYELYKSRTGRFLPRLRNVRKTGAKKFKTPLL